MYITRESSTLNTYCLQKSNCYNINYYWFLFLNILYFTVALLSTVYGAPSKGSTKASLKKKQTCVKDCGDTYKPVCAGDGSKNISFGSECVLGNYNCENQKGKINDKIN